MTSKPLLIALCGHPGSGKSTFQRLLQDEYGIAPIDDGETIRKHVMEIVGLTPEDVYTQEGKLRYVTFCGRRWQVRELLGEYGKILERMFGDQVIAELALRRALEIKDKQTSLFASDKGSPIGYSFGSVRRQQGLVYQKAGGIVVEIVGNETGSGYEFDGYDRALVDFRLFNPGTSMEALHKELLCSNLGQWLSHRMPA